MFRSSQFLRFRCQVSLAVLGSRARSSARRFNIMRILARTVIASVYVSEHAPGEVWSFQRDRRLGSGGFAGSGLGREVPGTAIFIIRHCFQARLRGSRHLCG